MRYRCTRCQSQFMSYEMANLHCEMEHERGSGDVGIEFTPVSEPGYCYIFKQTAAVIARDIFELAKRNSEMPFLHTAYMSLLQSEKQRTSHSNRVVLLSRAIPERLRLIKLSSGLPSRQSVLWKSLESDNRSVLKLLQQAVHEDKEEIMQLREDAAAAFLTLVDTLLYPSGPGLEFGFSQLLGPALDSGTKVFKDALRRISVRLSMASFQLPEGLYVKGVHLVNSDQVAFGAYGDIHVGHYRGRRVALKTMRVFTWQRPDDLAKNIKSFCREIAILHSLDHRNICGFIGVDRELFGGRFCLVTEWMPHGNIMDFVKVNSFVLGEHLEKPPGLNSAKIVLERG